MKVLLINPPFQRLKGFENLYFPLGLGYLAAEVANRGFEVRIYDAELPQKGENVRITDHVSLLNAHSHFIQALNEETHPVWRELSSTISSYKPNVVGITVLTPLYAPAKKIAYLCKNLDNKCIVVWGGSHPTLEAEKVLQKEKDVDFVVRGEGEVTFGELIWQLAKGSQAFHQIDGLSYRLNDVIKHNKARDLIQNLSDMPLPRKDLLLNDVSDNRIFRNIITSRGCPNDCAYCSSTKFWTRKVRYRTISSVMKEINHLQNRYHISELDFWDDNFTLNRKRIFELCKSMISQKSVLSWWCNTRADLIDEEMLKIMKRAGCNVINIGVETGSEKTLSYLNRALSLQDITTASKLLAKSGMQWYAYFMAGFPYETVEDIEDTRRLMHDISAIGVYFSVFNPYPGTKLFETCTKLELISKDPDWSKFSHQSPQNHFIKDISKEEFSKIVWKIAEEADEINKAFSSRLKLLIAKKRFYLRNPAVFLKKLKHKTRRLLILFRRKLRGISP